MAQEKIIVISSPTAVPSEIEKVSSLFNAGLKQFHVRKPNFLHSDMENYIKSIPICYHKYLVLHSHYGLAVKYNLKGIQIGYKSIQYTSLYSGKFCYLGYSAHSFSEIEEYKDFFTHFFISPIYNSISKSDYKSNFSENQIINYLENNYNTNIIALGGIDESNCRITLNMGFSTLAFLGAIWQSNDVVKTYSNISKSLNFRPTVLSIAGFDPSSGAGVSADIKTFEQHKVIGFGVTTSITYQNESEFLDVDWLLASQIERQIDVLLIKHNPLFVKIGLVENIETLKMVVRYLKNRNSEVKIIWDPILKASAGFTFHNTIDRENLFLLLQNIYLITPNIPECKQLFGTCDYSTIQQMIIDNNISNVLIKGGHSDDNSSLDVLITKDDIIKIEGVRVNNKGKHGSGCVLSSAICANLSQGFTLEFSVRKAKLYITQFISSNDSLLGFHN